MKLTPCRRITQVAFILLIFLMPVFDILRYDTATRELIIFGNTWGLGLKEGFYADQSPAGALHVALQFFLKAILPWIFFLAIFPILGYFTGRLFCGWLCPEGALFELSDFLTLKILGRRNLFSKKPNDPDANNKSKRKYLDLSFPLVGNLSFNLMKKDAGQASMTNTGAGDALLNYRADNKNRYVYIVLAVLSAIVIPLAGGIALTGYFVAPKTIWHQIVNWEFTFGVKAGIIGVSIYMLITSILVRHALCRFVCAAGLMQMLFGWVSPVSLRLVMDTSRAGECTNCKGCDKACFMNVLPRKNKRDISCVNCGACIDACNKELGAGKGLFHLNSGSPAKCHEYKPAKIDRVVS